MKKTSKVTVILLAIYLILLTWIIVFKMAFNLNGLPNYRSINLIPFAGSAIINGRISYDEIFSNLIAFMPIGVYTSMLRTEWSFPRKLLPAFAISFAYEALQYILGIGASDITDLISNTLGGAAGIAIVMAMYRLFKDQAERILKIVAVFCTTALIALISVLLLSNI